MYDFRPVGQVIGRLVIVLGISMLAPLLLDLADADGNAGGFGLAAFLTLAAGLALNLINRVPEMRGLTRPQAFLLTVLIWLVLPVFGALPFVFGAPGASYTDAFFEAMSGMTTTGSTVFSGLDAAPRGMLLWRALLQWYGGLGIVIVAIVFLPAMRVGGMQFFRTEAFDLGEIMPRVTEMAASLLYIYLGLTVGAMLGYAAAGMSGFDALCHAMTTVSTGGFANYDASFGAFQPAAHYVGALFMALGALPFVRMVQMTKGNMGAMHRDSQAQAYLAILLTIALLLTAWMLFTGPHRGEAAFRHALFNAASALTGTGYATEAYDLWGGFAVAIFFIVPLIGGCTGSTSCSAKVFRYQILFAALWVQIKRIHNPHGVFPLRYQGRSVDPEVVSAIMGFFFVFACSLAIWAILLSLIGLDTTTAISGSVAALTNLGPGLGPVIGPAGNFAPLPDLAKWVLALGMLLGRLEFLSVLVLLMPVFWQR